jgi:ribonuclease-3
MDLGLLHAKEFVLRIYNDPNFIDLNKIMIDDNFKDHLMKYCQIMNIPLPEYRVVGHHEGIFYIDTYINGQFGGRGKPRVKSKPNNWQLEHSLNNLKTIQRQ